MSIFIFYIAPAKARYGKNARQYIDN